MLVPLLVAVALCVSPTSAAHEHWVVDNSRLVDEKLKFYIHFEQCNTEQLEKIAYDVSNPSHSSYGKHLTSEEVIQLTRCRDHDAIVDETSSVFRNAASQLRRPVDITAVGNSLRIETSAIVVETVFRTPVQIHVHMESDARYTLLESPAALDIFASSIGMGREGGIQLITGLTERTRPNKYKAMAAGTGALAASLKPIPGENDTYTNITNWVVNPRLIRLLYNVPEGLNADAGSANSQGVAAFNDYYTPSDLCAAHTLLADDDSWLTPPDITYHGPDFKPNADEYESDLDTQYITAMAPGVTTWFVNHDSSEWILEWAVEATTTYAPSNGGPYVWSISYGFPEAWQCMLTDDYCTSSYDPTLYLQQTNIQLQSLAAMGVSVFVSSGDDGAPGYSSTCPVDPTLPVWETGATCPFDEGCQCATAVVEYESQTCTLPSGLIWYFSGAGLGPGAECDIIFTSACNNALGFLVDDTSNGCRNYFDGSTLSFWSTCPCDELPTKKSGGCSASGYVYDQATYGSMFAPDFPTSSPWVTSVGATMMRWVSDDMCAQGDTLMDMGTAETAQNLFTSRVYDAGGGFSMHFATPDYQKDFTAQYVASDVGPPSDTYNASNRGYPDISAIGSNFLVVVDGEPLELYGTSASAPTFAGMIALFNDQLIASGRSPLGFLNPLLYEIAREQPSIFRKIKPTTVDTENTYLEQFFGSSYTVGGNYCSGIACCEYAFMGTDESGTWDPVTGLGVLDFSALADYVGLDLSSP